MKNNLTPIAAAVALFLMGAGPAVQAQQADPAAPAAKNAGDAQDDKIQQVTVSGIRASRQQSLVQKRNADSVMDVVTAEDIGKLPDKNVADAVQRVPGVNISSGSGGQGGFSENDRVSIRGTSPSLTQTMMNGHSISTGDWYVGDQAGTVGRSVSFTLLPSEIVNSVEVQKSAQADYVEGGVVGNINIVTRTPLSFKKQLTFEATLQAFYADMPKKTDPQVNALVNWNNAEKTFGALFQVFAENRHERRDGQEFLGYSQVPADGAVAAAHPDLANVYYPSQIGSALFTQHTKRQGGLFDLEFKPSRELSFNVNGFYSRLHAPSLDTNYMANPVGLIEAGVSPTGYTVRNNTLVAASFPALVYDPSGPDTPAVPGLRDEIYRPNAGSSAAFLDLSGKYRLGKDWTFSAKLGKTRGVGETPHDYGHEANLVNSGLEYQMFGKSGPAKVSFPGVDTANYNNPLNVTEGGSWSQSVKISDEEVYGQLDAELALHSGIWESAKFGARYAHHTRSAFGVNYSCNAAGACDAGAPYGTLPSPVWNGGTSPANFGSAIGFGPGYLSHFWRLDPAALEAWQEQNLSVSQGPNYQGNFSIDEKDSAVYAMANLAGEHWRGNVGLRLVQTKQLGSAFKAVMGVDPVTHEETEDIVGYDPTTSAHTYRDVLPSANVKFDLSKDLVARLALAKTMARADYSALSPAVQLNNIGLVGGGGNPDLKPVRSTNFDASLEWYFAPQSLVSLGVFYMDMPSYVTFGTHTQVYNNTSIGQPSEYVITSPFNIAAKNKGFEIAYQQSFGKGFGTALNFTYADGKSADGAALVGSSKNTGNVEAFYENDTFSARLAYNYRSSFLVGLANAVPQNAAAVGSLAGSIKYTINSNFSLTFDALNLNNSKLKYYGANVDQPVAFYSSGRQYFFGVRMSM